VRALVVDAFTDTAFRGNPAGVVLLDRPARPEWMQAVAAELRHSETAFVHPLDAAGRYGLRWFTPAVEVDLCGHATLAVAHVLGRSGETLTFETRSGLLTTTVGHDGTVTMDFPAVPAVPADAPAALLRALDLSPTTVRRAGPDWLLEVARPHDVTRLHPDMSVLAPVECRGVIVTAGADQSADHDFVSRFFAPHVGVPEDPVTGSAHCALAPFWAARLGRHELVGVQLSERGGRIRAHVRGDRVQLLGRAVTVLDGELVA
jgi:PhzF family phenazine biosynthesis protein